MMDKYEIKYGLIDPVKYLGLSRYKYEVIITNKETNRSETFEYYDSNYNYRMGIQPNKNNVFLAILFDAERVNYRSISDFLYEFGFDVTIDGITEGLAEYENSIKTAIKLGNLGILDYRKYIKILEDLRCI